MSRYTIQDVIGAPKAFVSVTEYGADRKSAKVELCMDDSVLPRLVFTWKPTAHFFHISKEEATALRAAGFPTVTEMDSRTKEETTHCYVQRREETKVTFLNFRRYGWSWTFDPTGEQWYSRGHTYANGVVLPAATQEQVIRDSLVQTWTEAKILEEIPGWFDNASVQHALAELLADAVKHASRHACPDHVNGVASDHIVERVSSAKKAA